MQFEWLVDKAVVQPLNRYNYSECVHVQYLFGGGESRRIKEEF